MEKLKVYGEKNGAFDLIAAIYVKDGAVIVEAENPEIKACLEELVRLGTVQDEDIERLSRRGITGIAKYALRERGGFRTEDGRDVYGIRFYPPGHKKYLSGLGYRLCDLCEHIGKSQLKGECYQLKGKKVVCSGYKLSLAAWMKREIVEE